MLKDAKGFLWIGSPFGELTRFDGARFKTFMPDPKKPGAINAGGVTAFVEDSLHNIWMLQKAASPGMIFKLIFLQTFLPTLIRQPAIGSMIPFGSTNTHIYCFESRTRIVTFDIRSLEKKTVLTSSQPFNNNDNSFCSTFQRDS